MKAIVPSKTLKNKILIIRGQKVMIDYDLANLYGIGTKQLTRQVRRNIKRFPNDFMFQLTKNESLRCQIGTSKRGGRRYLPYVFTEQGVAMLSSILNSERAILVNIGIMRIFVKIRRTAYLNKETIETQKLLTYKPENKLKYENSRLISILEQVTKEIKSKNISSTLTNKLDQLSETIKTLNGTIMQAISRPVLPTGTNLISPEMPLTKLSDDIVNLIEEINEIAISKSGDKIFNVTSKTQKASHDLHKPVKTRKDLNEFIDALYFIIFEGSKQTKKFPKNKISEFLDPMNSKRFKDDFVVVEIRNLRWVCSHDPDFKKKSKVMFLKVSKICKKYVNKDSIPEFTQQDFLKFQEEILKEVKQFLLKLKYAISL